MLVDVFDVFEESFDDRAAVMSKLFACSYSSFDDDDDRLSLSSLSAAGMKTDTGAGGCAEDDGTPVDDSRNNWMNERVSRGR